MHSPLIRALLLVLSLQPRTPVPAVRVAGTGTQTYVLLAGMVGGVAGFQRLERELLAIADARIITIDAYQLSLDSADVTFDALARRVNAELAAREISNAVVVGHAHGGGVALRLASRFPDRVREVVLLDVGAQPDNRSPVFTSSLKLVPMIVHLPFGRRFVRQKYVKGVLENSGRTEWFDEATQRAYTEPLLEHTDVAIGLALRLGRAEEPELVRDVVRRIRVPIRLIAGELKRPAGPTAEEMEVLTSLGDRFGTQVLPGVGHFPHEEAPAELARLLIARPIRLHPACSASKGATDRCA
jgi:pimeloyl-ACP methyl ester carboxylesterase